MTSVRLEKARETFSETEKERIAKLMSCPYLEEELAGVYERGVRLSVERLAKNSKVPKAILFANTALGKELTKQTDCLELAKHHRLIVISWNQRQFFLRQMFDSQSNFRFATRKVSSDGLHFAFCNNKDADRSDTFSDIFDCLVTEMSKATRPPVQSSKDPQRALSVTICETPTINSAKRRSVYSAPARTGRSCKSANLRAHQRPSIRPTGPPDDLLNRQLPYWYSCLTTKLWMLPKKEHCPPGRKRAKSVQSVVSSHRPSTAIMRSPSPDYGRSSGFFDGQADDTGDLTGEPRITRVCDSMRKWTSVKNRAVLKRILPTLPDKSLQKMMDLFGEDIEEQKRFLQNMSKSLSNRNALKDKRWRNLEALLKTLHND